MSRSIPLRGLAPVTAADLVGRWHIVQTNFPMWLDGKKTEPTFNYGALAEPSRLDDVVRYRAGGKEKEIRGVDTQDPNNPAHFTWRGRGLLALLSSDWYVAHLAGGVMAIYFTPTLFTPAGMDIASRTPDPDRALVDAARKAAAAIVGLDAQVSTLVSLRSSAG